MKIRRSMAALAILVAVLLLGMLVIGRRSPGNAPSEMTKLRIGLQDNVICALPFIAAEKGYFRQAGLDVEIVPYPSGKLALNAMFEGAVDVAAAADTAIMAASFQRKDFTIFATIASTERSAWIVARPDKGIHAPRDLRGKRIATQRNSGVHFFLSAYLARHGIREEEVDLAFMQAVDLPRSLAEGRIDAFSMRNPFAAQARALLGGDVVEMFDPDIYRQTFNLAVWKSSMATNAPAFERLLKALLSAEKLVIRDEDAARRAVVAQLGADREAEVLADWRDCAFVLSLDQSIFVTLEDQARWALANEPALASAIPNYLEFIDARAMLVVKPAAVSVIR
jgi:NitT/TauT family transport system substrate-binding protein